ncbi:hypothetical protein Tco_0600339, partial [Tanacetum coccineum]
LFKTNHNTGLRRILGNLEEVQDAVKEDPALNKKVLEAIEAYTKNSTNLTQLLTLVKTFDFSGIKSIIESLKAVVDARNDHLAKWAKPSTNLAYSNLTYIATKETPSYTEGEKDDMVTKESIEKEPTKNPEVENVKKEPKSASRPIPVTIVRPLTKPALELEMIGSSSRIQLTDTILEPDRGKGKVTDDVESPPKLVKASSKVRPAPDEPVRVPFEINGKLYHLTNEEIQVVHEEAAKAGVDPKILASSKGG